MANAKLFILEMEIELLWTDMEYYRETRVNGKPDSEVLGGLITIGFPANSNTDKVLEWMTKESLDKTGKELDKMEKGKVCFYADGFDYPPTRTYEFNDAFLTYFSEEFHAESPDPMTTVITISPAIQNYAGEEFVKRWNVNWEEQLEETVPVVDSTKPSKIVSVDWVNETGAEISEIHYGKKAEVRTTIQHQKGGDVNLVVTKKDGTEFEPGKKEITLTKTAKEGEVVFSKFEIKKDWEEYKSVDEDELVAEVSYDGKTKKSSKLEIIPTPKVLVSFRPNDSWKGEFGFDWIREGETSLFKDNKFEDIISKQYKEAAFTNLERNSNEYKGFFKKDPTQFEKLQEEYKPFDVDWKKTTDASGAVTKEKHFTQWMSIKKEDEGKIKMRISVTDEADYLEFEENEHFTITPMKVDISGKTGEKTLNDEITIKCKTEFASDQEIVIKAYHEGVEEGVLAGKLNVWENAVANHKQKKVVFVEVTSDASGSGVPKVPNAANEKDRINKYLSQAYIELHPDSVIESIDLSAEADFARFVNGGRIMKESRVVPMVPATATTAEIPEVAEEKLVDYLKNKLKDIDAKYSNNDFFKAYYFKENGYHPNGNLSGYSAASADYVVVFKSANNQTAAHEFLHSFKLAHTFTNSEASRNAEFTYEAKETDNLLDYSHNPGNNNNRCSLFYWQWKRANNSIT